MGRKCIAAILLAAISLVLLAGLNGLWAEPGAHSLQSPLWMAGTTGCCAMTPEPGRPWNWAELHPPLPGK